MSLATTWRQVNDISGESFYINTLAMEYFKPHGGLVDLVFPGNVLVISREEFDAAFDMQL